MGKNKIKDYKNLIMVNWKGFEFSPSDYSHCESIEPLTSEIFKINAIPVTSVEIKICKNYHSN